MIWKLLLTCLVIAGAVIVLKRRGQRMQQVASQQPPAPAASSSAIKFAAVGVVVIGLLGAGLYLYFQWQDNYQIVTVRVIDTRSGSESTYQAYKGDIDSRTFYTTEGRQVTLAEVERLAPQGQSRPLYVECREKEAVVWPEGTVVEAVSGELEAGSFKEWLLSAGVNYPGDHVIFLIRPSGIATFDVLRDLSERSGLKVGYEPVLEHWELFFS